MEILHLIQSEFLMVVRGKDLNKPIKQSDGTLLTSFQQAYGFDIKTMTESSCVAELMKMYQQLVEEK